MCVGVGVGTAGMSCHFVISFYCHVYAIEQSTIVLCLILLARLTT